MNCQRRPPRWATGSDPCGDGGLSRTAGGRTTVVTDDGARLSVLVAGPEAGPVVVLAHCWMGRMELWGPVARRLVDSGHRVVLFDQRGHGGSSPGSSGLAVDRLGDDLGSILAGLGLDDVVLAGHSMGGMAVLALAAHRPGLVRERVRGIALVATSAHNGPLRVPPPLAHAVLGERASKRLAKRDPWALRRAVGVDAPRDKDRLPAGYGVAAAVLFPDVEYVPPDGWGREEMCAAFGCTVDDLPDGEGWGNEHITRCGSHMGTHVDAPLHYGSQRKQSGVLRQRLGEAATRQHHVAEQAEVPS